MADVITESNAILPNAAGLYMKTLGILASIGAALGSFGLGHVYLSRLEAEISGGPRVSVLVAAEDIATGALLTEKLLAVREIPQAYVEPRQVRSSEVKKILGTRIASGLKAADSVLWSDLAQFSDHARTLSGLVQNGLRAVAIDGRVAEFQGLLRPGDRVDVLLSSGAGQETNSTSTLLQNLLVLSVGGNVSRGDENSAKPFSRGTALTVSATPEQAQVLTQAEQRGRLTLTLRNSEDVTLVEGLPETTARELLTPARGTGAPRTAPGKGSIERVR